VLIELDDDGLRRVVFDELDLVTQHRRFLADPDATTAACSTMREPARRN